MNWPFRLLVLALFTLPIPLTSPAAQDVRVGTPFDASMPPDPGAKLAFSKDGKVLHAIGTSRAIAYSVQTGAVIHTLNVNVLANTADGRTAIVEDGGFFLVDTETGQRQDIPLSWFDQGSSEGWALSGDGRLISNYSEAEIDNAPQMVVTVVDWTTKSLVARQSSKYISAGGGFSGGVTIDGAIEFVNNRVGRKIVNLKTGDLIAWFGFLSVRSPDGAWVIEFPDRLWHDSAPKEVLIKDGRNGLTDGELDVQVADDEVYGAINGSFCGTTARFILARGRGVAVYAIPSGKLLASIPAETWRDPNTTDTDHVSVTCSSNGTRVAILSGARLTVHELSLAGGYVH